MLTTYLQKSHWLYLITILFFSLVGMKALFHPDLFTAHDIWHQIVRFYYYSQAISDGQFPPYWIDQLANRFGYPLFIFSYHLPWLIGVLLLKIGFDFASAMKTLFFLSYLLSGIFMYFFISSLLKDRLAALLVSILYLWLPYHFLITFVSASIGIAFVFSFLPVLFLGIHLSKEESTRGPILLALGLSGIILSHIMHLVFIIPLVLIFTIWEFKNTYSKVLFIKNILLAIIIGSLLSSFYLIPASFYNQFTRIHKEEGITKLYERNFITINQLVYSKWGYSPIVNNAKNGEISFQLGISQWIAIICLFVLSIFRKSPKGYQSLGIYLFIAFIVNIFLMLNISFPIWKFVIKYVALDFPFRLILPTSFIASLAAGIILINLPRKAKYLFFVSLIAVAIYTNRNHLNINQYTNFPISTYLDLETEITTNTFNEYLPSYANTKLLNRPWNEVIGNNISSYNSKQTTNSLFFNINATEDTKVSIGQFYFPGQILYLDKKVSQFEVDQEGRISFNVPKGIHIVTVNYQQTSLIKLSQLLTITGVAIVIILLLKNALPKKFTFKQA